MSGRRCRVVLCVAFAMGWASIAAADDAGRPPAGVSPAIRFLENGIQVDQFAVTTEPDGLGNRMTISYGSESVSWIEGIEAEPSRAEELLNAFMASPAGRAFLVASADASTWALRKADAQDSECAWALGEYAVASAAVVFYCAWPRVVAQAHACLSAMAGLAHAARQVSQHCQRPPDAGGEGGFGLFGPFYQCHLVTPWC